MSNSQCINISNPRIQKLSKLTGLHPRVVGAKAKIWQDKVSQDKDALPTLKEFVSNTYDLKTRNARTLYSEKAEFKSLGTPETFEDYVRLIDGEPNIQDYKNFLNGEYWKIKDAETKAIDNRIYDLQQGVNLTEQEFQQSREAVSLLAKTEADKQLKEDFRQTNTEGNITTITIVPSPQRDRIKTPAQAMETGRKIARAINQTFRHPLDNSEDIAEVRSYGDSAIVSIKYSMSDIVFRANFDTKDTLVTPRLRKKLFEKKALMSLYSEGKISTNTYLEQTNKRELRNADLMLKENEIKALRDLDPLLLPKVLIDGKLYENTEEANKVREEKYKPFNEQLEIDFNDAEFSINIARDPISIEAFKTKRQEQIKSLNKKIESLSNRARATKNYNLYNPRKKELEKIKEKFENDLNNEDLVKDPLKVVKESFEEDIKIIKEIQKDANLDNLFVARDLIQLLKNNLEKQANKKGYIFSEDATITDIQDVTSSLNKDISALSSKQSDITLKYFTEIVDKRYDDTLQNLYPGKTKKEILDTLLSQIKNDDLFSYQARSLGRSFTQNDPIGQIIRLEYEFERNEERAKVSSLMKNLTDLKDSLKDVLKEQGFDNWFQAFTRQTNKGDVELISKFSEQYKDFIRANFYRERKRAYEARNKKDWFQQNVAYNNMYNNLKDNVNFVQISKLPEVANYLKNSELESEISTDNTYAKQLRKELGDVEYQSLIEKQIGFIEDFKLKKKEIIDNTLLKKGVERFEDLSSDDKNKLNQLIDTYNPFFLAKNTDNLVPLKLGTQTYTSPHKLEFNTFYPKRKKESGENTGFYDSKFETIEKTPELLEAWKLLENATFVINSGFAGTSLNLNKRSILYLQKSILDTALDSAPKHILGKIGKEHLENSLAWLRNPFSSYQSDTQSDNIKLATGVKSFKNEISSAWQQDLDFLANLTKYEGKSKKLESNSINFDAFTIQEQEAFLDNFGIEIKTLENDFKDSSSIPVSGLKNYSQQRVYDNQKVDMVKLYKMMLEQASLHKAKDKAYQTTTEIIDPLLEDVSYYENAKYQEKKKENFKDLTLRNDRSTGFMSKTNVGNISSVLKRFSKDGKIDLGLGSLETKNLNAEQKRIVKIVRERLDTLRDVSKKLEGDADIQEEIAKHKEEVDSEIERLEIRLENMGKDFTAKDIYEAIAIKIFIRSKLGLNVWAFFQNLLQGRQQANIQAGFKDKNGKVVGDYTKKQYNDADSFLSKVSITPSKKVEQQKAHALISQLNIIEDGSDFEQRAERTGISQKPEWRPWKKGAWRWMILTEIGEYMNQAPLILATFSNYNMPDGNPIFNGKTFPYHEIKDGALVLKEKYLNAFDGYSKEKMIADYQDFNSTEASRFVLNASQIIRRRNGDYADSGVIDAKKTLLGKSVFTFANWLGEIAGAAYDVEKPNFLTGKKEGGYIKKVITSTESRQRSVPLITQYTLTSLGAGAVYGGMSGVAGIMALTSTLPGMILPGVLAFLVLRLAIKNRNNNESESSLGTLTTDSLKLLGYNMTIGSLMPLIQGATSLLNKVSNSNFDFEKQHGLDYTFGGKLTEEEALAMYKSSNQANLMQFIAMVQTMAAYALVSAIGGEEEDELIKVDVDGKKYDNPYYALQDERRVDTGKLERLKYFAFNFLNQAYKDTGLTTNPGTMFYTLLGKEDNAKAFSPLSEYTSIALGAFNEDVTTDSSSPYYGQSKGWQKTKKAFLPKPFHNIMEVGEGDWYFGLENMSYKIYDINPIVENILHTDLKKDQKEINSKRSNLRTDIRSNLENYLPVESVEHIKENFGTTNWNSLPKEVQKYIDKHLVEPTLNERYPSPKKEARQDYDEKQKRKKE